MSQDTGSVVSAMTQLLERVRPAAEPARVTVRADGRVRFVPVTDIDWVEADGG